MSQDTLVTKNTMKHNLAKMDFICEGFCFVFFFFLIGNGKYIKYVKWVVAIRRYGFTTRVYSETHKSEPVDDCTLPSKDYG